MIVFASLNRGKCREAKALAAERGIELIAPVDLTEQFCATNELSAPVGVPPDVVEDADTYIGNAQLKAEAFHRWSGLPVIADDSGLEVEALNGGPGVFTARFAGPGATDLQNNEKLLRELKGQSSRAARYVCYLYCLGFDQPITEFGELCGTIAEAPSGGGGFGYDPIFCIDGEEETLAELKARNVVVETHRIRALKKLFVETLGA